MESEVNMTEDYNVTNVSTEFHAFGDTNAWVNYQTVDEIIRRIVLPIICVLGITGLILTVIVLSRKNMCTSTNCYLISLAIADLLFLIVWGSSLIDGLLVPHSRQYYTFGIYKVHATIFLHIFLMASIYSTVMLAIERYFAICQPFLAAKICTVTKARVCIIVIFIIALLIRLPNFWESKVTSVYDPSTNMTWAFIEGTEFAYDHWYQTVYPWFVDAVINSIIPFLLLLALNVCLIWEVRKSTKYLARNLMVQKGAGTVAQREELQITIMLISVIIVFFICQAPYVIYTAIASINKFQAPSTSFMLFRSITLVMLTLKSAINFILYCWFSEKFWATLKRIFCKKCCLRRNENYLSQNGNYYHLRRLSSTAATRETTF